ncbi:MAG: hypothetical protein ACR2K4_00885 [Candidatus Limnocylindria bacterium]
MKSAAVPEFGPNTQQVRQIIEIASVMLAPEAGQFARTMTLRWSFGRVDAQFPPFIEALSAACRSAVSSGRLAEFKRARAVGREALSEGWESAWPVARVGVGITASAAVVADLLSPAHRALLLEPLLTVRDRRQASHQSRIA